MAGEITTVPAKTPGETLDYSFDYADETINGTDPIQTSATSFPSLQGLAAADTHTASTAAAYLSGGAAGVSYLVKNTVTLAGGRVFEKFILVPVVAYK